MKRSVLLTMMVLMVFSTPLLAEEKTFKIDPVHSSLQFKVRHLYSILVGRFNGFSGTMTVDMKKRTIVSVEAEVDIFSVYTANDAREKHLLNADFFDSSKHPKAVFKSTRIIKGEDDSGSVVGNMTIRGVTKEVVFKGKFLGYGMDHRKGKRAGFTATAKIDRREFGITYNHTLPNGKTVLGDHVELELNIEAIEVPKR